MKHACKRIMACLLVLALMMSVVPAAFAANIGSFTDIADTAWYAEYVAYVYENDLMEGMSDTTFAPDAALTRAQAVTVLYRLAGSPAVQEPASFTDLTQDWYAAPIAWAEDMQIAIGMGNGCFAPEMHVTRQELVTMLWRYHDCPSAEADCDFPDAGAISDWAAQAMDWALAEEILHGIPHGAQNYLEPNGRATRAQFAKLIALLAGYLPAVDGAVILYTNDVHTYIDKALSYDSIAALKTEMAQKSDGVLLVDAGDHVQGTAYGSMDNGETIIRLMNAAGYDLATLGNHEFDYGMARALELIGKAEFPYVSANFYHESNGVAGARVLDAYRIFEVGDYRVAFVGVTTPETFTKSTPAYFMDEDGNYIYGISGGDDGQALYADVQAAIDQAAAEDVDFVIAIGHCGDDPSSRPWTSEEVIANTTGLDAWIDGHSHSTVEGRTVLDKAGNEVLLTQTGEYFNAIGRMILSENGITTELIDAYTGSDPAVAAIRDAWMEEVDTLLGVKIADNTVDFRINDVDEQNTRLIRSRETNLGDFTADALYYLFDVTEGLAVDCAIMNGGGIRANMPAGELSYKSTKNVHTFGNVACLITVTGQQLLDALEWGAKNVGVGESGGFLQVSGITYEIHSYIEPSVQQDEKGVWIGGPTNGYRVKNVTVGGAPLDLSATYNLAGYNYTLRDLGDGFAMFDGAVNVKDYVMEDYLVLANYAMSFPQVDGVPTIEGTNSVLGADYSSIYGEGRITILSEKPDESGICDPHEYTEQRVEPTCVQEGYIIYTCTKCGDSYKEILEATGEHVDADRDGACDGCGMEMEIPPIYTLTNTLKAGDQVIIVNAAKNKALSGEYNGYYNKAVTVAPAEGKLENSDSTIVWTVGKEGENYTFSYEGKKLSMQESYSSMPLDSVNSTWTISDGTAADTHYVCNVARGAYIEYQDTYDTWSAYYDKSTNNELFELSFYVIAAEGGEEEPEPTPEAKTYTLTNTLKEGDQVIIVNAAKNKALSSEIVKNFYKAGVDVTISEQTIETAETAIVWTVMADSEGFNLVNAEGQKLSIDGDFNSIPYDKEKDAWTLQAASTEQCVYVVNENGKYLQWTSYGNYSAYTYSEENEETFAMQLYTLKEEEKPAAQRFEKLTDAGSLKAGDRIILVSEANHVAAAAIGTGKFFTTADVTFAEDGSLTAEGAIVITLGGDATNGWTLTTSEGTVCTAAAKALNLKGNGESLWTISIDADGNATVASANTDYGRLLYNVNSPRFMNYTSDTNKSMLLPQIYILRGAGE